MTNTDMLLFKAYEELGYLRARIDMLKRRIAYLEKASVPDAPPDEPVQDEEQGE